MACLPLPLSSPCHKETFMRSLYEQLIASLLPGNILAVLVGLSRTAVKGRNR